MSETGGTGAFCDRPLVSRGTQKQAKRWARAACVAPGSRQTAPLALACLQARMLLLAKMARLCPICCLLPPPMPVSPSRQVTHVYTTKRSGAPLPVKLIVPAGRQGESLGLQAPREESV